MKGPGIGDNFEIDEFSDSDAIPESSTSIMNVELAENGLINDYKGYKPPTGSILQVDRIDVTISPEDFYANYVLQRKPVVISGLLTDHAFKCHCWTNNYLKREAGNADVIVEQRGQEKDATFGLLAPKINMKYEEFVSNIQNGNDRLYMTTQDLERFEDDLDDFEMPKSILAEPLKSLADDFPQQPKLLGNLIPYQLSLWHGLAKSGSSSGLHHDYHDNLYLLLRGRKRFRLFPPSAVLEMKTAGIPAKVHSNGLIVYRNKPDDPTVVVRSDGVPMSFLARQSKDQAEKDLMDTEDALENLASSDLSAKEKEEERIRLETKLTECEDRIDKAMEEILVYGCPGDEHEDFDSDEDTEPECKKVRTEISESFDEGIKMPDHFCDMIFPTEVEKESVLFDMFPHLKSVGGLVCELNPSEMLYLPASWFHEVTSYSEDIKTDNSQPVKSSEDKGHLALNYWMYPPDGDTFAHPYKGDFWPNRWHLIKDSPPPPIQKVWSSDDEEEEGEEVEESEEENN